MVVALLAVLGVDLIVIVALVASLLARRRWVKKQEGSFRGVIRVADGDIDGLEQKWGKGYGHWVSDVLIWTKAPFLFRHAFVAPIALVDRRVARSDEVKRLGDRPAVIGLSAPGGTIEVAAHDDARDALQGPFATTADPAV